MYYAVAGGGRRRSAEFIRPIPKPRKRRGSGQQQLIFDEGAGLSTQRQRYDPTPIINALRGRVDEWRRLPNPRDWGVTPETARLLRHWRHHPFSGVRPFLCQIEAVETAIWQTEVAPGLDRAGRLTTAALQPRSTRGALRLRSGRIEPRAGGWGGDESGTGSG